MNDNTKVSISLPMFSQKTLKIMLGPVHGIGA